MTRIHVVLWIVSVFASLMIACETPRPSPSAPPQAPDTEEGARQQRDKPAHPESALTLVTDRSLVCMVNNQFMGTPQIPVEVDGRTYYGCCQMCKGRLGSDPSSRMSTDPVSGKAVDKATAVIGRDEGGRTLYFESDQTFASYTGEVSL